MMASLVSLLVTAFLMLMLFFFLITFVVLLMKWCSSEDDTSLSAMMARHSRRQEIRRQRVAAIQAEYQERWQPERERIINPNAPCRQPNCSCCSRSRRR